MLTDIYQILVAHEIKITFFNSKSNYLRVILFLSYRTDICRNIQAWKCVCVKMSFFHTILHLGTYSYLIYKKIELNLHIRPVYYSLSKNLPSPPFYIHRFISLFIYLFIYSFPIPKEISPWSRLIHFHFYLPLFMSAVEYDDRFRQEHIEQDSLSLC